MSSKNTLLKHCLTVIMVSLFLIAFAGRSASAQVFPSNLDKTRSLPNSRSQALGGMRLLGINDATAGAFNPALMADVDAGKGRMNLSLQASARNNIPYWKALNFVDDVNDIAYAIREDPSSVDFDDIAEQFGRLFNYAERLVGNLIEGKSVSTGISVAPSFGLSYKNIGIVTFGGIGGLAVLTPGESTNAEGETGRRLAADAGFLDLVTVGVPYAFRIPTGYMGVSLKAMRADYTGVSYVVDEANRTLTGRFYSHVKNTQPDVDLGYRSDAFPLSGSRDLKWQVGAAARYILFPRFTLPARPKKETVIGDTPPPLRDFNFQLKPEFSMGGLVSGKTWLASLELHNMTGVNGGDASFHMGGEYTPVKWISLRGGYDQNSFVYGAGVNLGAIRVDAAVGTDYRRLVSVGANARF